MGDGLKVKIVFQKFQLFNLKILHILSDMSTSTLRIICTALDLRGSTMEGKHEARWLLCLQRTVMTVYRDGVARSKNNARES